MTDQKPKRIGIDARFYGPIGKGLGRYTKEIVDNIIKLDKENYYVIFLNKENYHDFNAASGKVKKVLTNIRWYSLAEQLIFPFYIRREKLDMMHWPHFNVPIFCPVKFVVTIHDLILLKFPTRRASTLGPFRYALKNFFYKLVIKTAIRRAKKILTVSHFTKSDIISRFKINSEKIEVAYEGVADLNAPPPLRGWDRGVKSPGEKAKDQNALSYYHISKPFLLYVGNAYPHKNLEGLINVFLKIRQEEKNLKLVLVGKEDYFYHRLKAEYNEHSARVLFPGYVPDFELKELYANAVAYVFPSFYEGFGLPPLEAMAQGLPVLSSNKTCLPEILGQAAQYFNPEDEAQMQNKILTLLRDEKLRKELRNRGLEQVKKYSWKTCAEKTLEVYLELL